jgi:hypothetical protein
MRLLRIWLLISLVSLLTASAWAQGSVPLSKDQRIALCEQKKDVPFDPADPEPLRLDQAKDVSRPIILRQVNPVGMKSVPREGAVIEAVIDEDGCIRQPKVTKGQGTSVAAAGLTALRKWVFEPATRDGKPVRILYVLTLSAHPG